jgi:hypothetical protein
MMRKLAAKGRLLFNMNAICNNITIHKHTLKVNGQVYYNKQVQYYLLLVAPIIQTRPRYTSKRVVLRGTFAVMLSGRILF